MDYKTALATVELLAEQYPRCFSVYERRRRPLKVHIHTDILAASDIPPAVLSAALRVYCGNRCYLEASKEGTPRVDLNGNVAGSVMKGEADNARQRLEQQRTKQKRGAAAQAKVQAQAEARNAGRVSLTLATSRSRNRNLALAIVDFLRKSPTLNITLFVTLVTISVILSLFRWHCLCPSRRDAGHRDGNAKKPPPLLRAAVLPPSVAVCGNR